MKCMLTLKQLTKKPTLDLLNRTGQILFPNYENNPDRNIFFVRFKGNIFVKRQLREDFHFARCAFDKELRKSKRMYAIANEKQLLMSKQQNNKCFWSFINKLKKKGSSKFHYVYMKTVV